MAWDSFPTYLVRLRSRSNLPFPVKDNRLRVSEGNNVKPKIFGIGFHKTGTTSLALALEMLGYRVTGPNGAKDPNIASNVHTMIDSLVPQFDAFQDNPWPVVYRYLDQKYVNSKFVLTTRDTGSWIRSQVKHFGKKHSPMREWIYGVGHPEGNETIYINRFERHNADVIEYFSNRTDDLLILDITTGVRWEPLCEFLNVDIPDGEFPHANRGVDRERRRAIERNREKRLGSKFRQATNRFTRRFGG